jgi:streptomycin 6-kinase
MFVIPDDFRARMVALDGEDGSAWLRRLPGILAHCSERWNITIDEPFQSLTYNYVAPAMRRDGTRAIIKASPPGGEFAIQSAALRLFDGHSMTQLLECDNENDVMLLERLLPGTTLRDMADDERATSIAASVMKQLWCPVPADHPFPTVQDWGKGFKRLRQFYNGGCGPFPRKLLEEAETLFAELSASMAEPVLLHGDLHHDNILAAQREPWLAIDPKGLVGEPAYETGAWLRNWLPDLLRQPQPERTLARRVDQFAAELGFDRARIRGWGLAQAVLSEWWTIEDFGGGWHREHGQDTLTCAELLATIKV